MFEKINTKNVINNDKGDLPATTAILSNNQIGKYISKNGATILKNVFSATANGFGKAFYQPYDFTVFQDSYAFKFIDDNIDIQKIHYFITTSLNKIYLKYNWGNKSGWNKIKEEKIKLPTKDGRIDFNFMKSLISELEEERISELEEERISELSAYLKVSRLENYELSDEEKQALERLPNIKWREYNLEKLFGKATRGRRLKSQDRIKGMLPFVTAGEANTGISDFIGNDVKVFDKNTITIDMFGSAKYRNYNYGCDDHIAVVHTENLKMEESIFITSAIHKTSYNGQFNYGRNFYAKDADTLNILLPINEKGIDYDFMNSLISAVQKLVIKEVVIYADEKIKATKKIVRKD